MPDFKSKDTVLHRPDGDPASPKTVAPGTFRVSADRPPSPKPNGLLRDLVGSARARGSVPLSSFGLRRDDLIVKDGDMFAVEDRLADYERWRDARATVIAAAARPSVRVQTATAWAAEAAEQRDR